MLSEKSDVVFQYSLFISEDTDGCICSIIFRYGCLFDICVSEWSVIWCEQRRNWQCSRRPIYSNELSRTIWYMQYIILTYALYVPGLDINSISPSDAVVCIPVELGQFQNSWWPGSSRGRSSRIINYARWIDPCFPHRGIWNICTMSVRSNNKRYKCFSCFLDRIQHVNG